MSHNGSILAWIRGGFAAAFSHKRLVLAFYLVPLLPALLWAWVASRHLHGQLDDRPFAQEILGGNAYGVIQDFLAGPDNRLGILIAAVPTLLVVTLLLTIALAAGAAPVLLGKGGEAPFFHGIGRYFGRYLRSLLAFAVTLIPGFVGIAVASGIGGNLATNAYDERFQYGAVAVGLLVFLLYFIPLDLAYDLSRLAAVEHDGRRTLRGYYRALWAVVRRPFKLIPFYLVLLVILGVVLWLVAQVRGGLIYTSTGTILAIVLVQQVGMLFRAFWQVSFWGAEVALYRDLGSPDWCGTPRSAPVFHQDETQSLKPTEAYALPGEEVGPASPEPASSAGTTPPHGQPESFTSVAPRAPVLTEPIEPVTEDEVEEGKEDRGG
jgi:hypothetical protein